MAKRLRLGLLRGGFKGVQEEIVGGHAGDVLDVWPNEVVQQVQVVGGGGIERRVQSRGTPSETKPGSLWTYFRRKRPALFQSGQWHFHQDNAPVHNSILVTDYLTKMGIKTVPHRPYSPDIAPCDFWLFPKPRGCRYERRWDERGCDEGHWNADTRGLPWGLSEVVWSVQVHCRRLLRRGLEFPVCTINKGVHTKKVWKLI